MNTGSAPPPSEGPGPLIGRGRAADVYDLGNGRVLRRNRNGASTEHEATAMRHLHRHGYPVPEVFEASGCEIVMERIVGATMLDAFGRRPWKIGAWAALLAELHQRLARVPLPEADLPHRFGPAEVVLHGDLHPDNVMLTARGPRVIDWPNVAVGPRGADVATTWILLATSDTDGGPVVRRMQSLARAAFVRRFLARAGRDRALRWLAAAAEYRLADRNVRLAEIDAINRLLARLLADESSGQAR